MKYTAYNLTIMHTFYVLQAKNAYKCQIMKSMYGSLQHFLNLWHKINIYSTASLLALGVDHLLISHFAFPSTDLQVTSTDIPLF